MVIPAPICASHANPVLVARHVIISAMITRQMNSSTNRRDQPLSAILTADRSVAHVAHPNASAGDPDGHQLHPIAGLPRTAE